MIKQKIPRVVYSHGKISHPNSTKARLFRDICKKRNLMFESIDYRGILNPDERAFHLIRHCHHLQRDYNFLLVGSSMGGYVSLEASRHLVRPGGLFLTAPAVYREGYLNPDPSPICQRPETVTIIAGKDDRIIPLENIKKYCQKHKARLVIADDDHSLRQSGELITNEFEQWLNQVL